MHIFHIGNINENYYFFSMHDYLGFIYVIILSFECYQYIFCFPHSISSANVICLKTMINNYVVIQNNIEILLSKEIGNNIHHTVLL